MTAFSAALGALRSVPRPAGGAAAALLGLAVVCTLGAVAGDAVQRGRLQWDGLGALFYVLIHHLTHTR